MRTFFVSLFGSDANSGLDPAAPLRTFAAAEHLAADGDTIRIAAGDYAEPLVTHKCLHVVGETTGASFTLPGDPRGEFRAPLVRFTGLTDGRHNSCRMDRGSRPPEERQGGSLRGLRFDNPGNIQCNLFAVFCNELVVEDCWFVDGAIWNAHAGWCNGTVWRRCLFLRAHGQHNLYVANSPKAGLVEWCLCLYAWNNNFQINADKNTLPSNGEVYDGIASDFVVQDNFWVGSAVSSRGTACNLDGLVHSVVRRNRVWLAGSSGLNLFKWDGTDHPHHVEILDNWLYVRRNTCLNLLPGVTNLTVTGNVLANEAGPSYIDDSGTAPPLSMIANNPTGTGNPYPAGYWDWLPAVDPLLPPPPPPPAPPPPPFKGENPVPALVADTARFDLATTERGVSCFEWDAADRGGEDFKHVSVQAPPDAYWDKTLVRQFPRPDYGMRFTGVWKSPVTAVIEVRAGAQGAFDLSFGGHVLLDGVRVQRESAETVRSFNVTEGQWYELDAGFAGTPDTVCALSLKYRTEADPEWRSFEATRCKPVRVGTVQPPPPGPGPGPGPNPSEPWREPFTPEQKALLLWFRDLFR